MYVVDLMLAIVTLVTMFPLTQVKGHKVNTVFIVATLKLTCLLLALIILNRVIFYKQMKRHSKLLYANSVCLLVITLVQDILLTIFEFQMANEVADEQNVGNLA